MPQIVQVRYILKALPYILLSCRIFASYLLLPFFGLWMRASATLPLLFEALQQGGPCPRGLSRAGADGPAG